MNNILAAVQIDTDPNKLNRELIHNYLTSSYWAKGITRELVDRSIEGSMCFGAYLDDQQVGFARVITDKATFSYLADVFIVAEQQGQGLGKLLITTIEKHPDLQGLRRKMLATRDAHGLYQKFGYMELQNPDRIMEIVEMYLPDS